MKHKHLHLILLALAAVFGAAVRFWTLSAAIDSQGLPVTEHPATITLIAGSIVFPLVFLVAAIKSPGRSHFHKVLVFSKAQSGVSMAAAWLILLSAIVSIFRSSGIAALVLFLLGTLSAFCLMMTSRLRLWGNQMPLPELIPVIYLVIKLILNFKDWSTDPIILDYCDMLFALIFTLLAFYGSAGFVFNKGQPRKALFYASVAVFFCAMAAVSDIMDGNFPTAIAYAGYLLWFIPVVQCLLTPRAASPKKEETKE